MTDSTRERMNEGAATAPVVSIIIPCFNAESFVADAIESALDQTYPHKEVIVIDDGSTDGSLEVVRGFGDRIRHRTGANRGGGAARNRGLDLARGDLIQFLDADDVLFPTKLAQQVPLLVRQTNALVFCDGESAPMAAPRAREVHRVRFDNGVTDPVAFALRGRIQTPSPLHTKSNLMKAGGFDASLPCAQERDLHLRLACLGLSFVHVQEVLYRARRVYGSVSDDYLRVLDQHEAIFRRAWKILEDRGALTEARMAAFAHALAVEGMHYVQRGRMGQACKIYRTARAMHSDAWLLAFHKALRPLARVAPVWAARVTTLKRRFLSC